MTLDVYKKDGTFTGEKLDLAKEVFEIEPNDHVIYLAVKAYLANQRQGTHKAKERGEVRGGGKKPWNQKGKGGARSGTSRSPLWIGGGAIFGPRPRDYRQALPKKVRALARKSALSYKVKDNQLVLIEDFTFEAPKTQLFTEVMAKLKLEGKKVLLVTGEHNEVVYKSGRNVDKVTILEASKVSTYDILNCQILLLQKGAAEYFNNTLAPKQEVAQ